MHIKITKVQCKHKTNYFRFQILKLKIFVNKPKN